MINYVDGDIFETTCDIIVIPVNCVGVLGKGLAKQFSKRATEYVRMSYKLMCHHFLNGRRSFVPGKVLPARLPQDDHLYFLLATKDHWKFPSQIEWIAEGLNNLRHELLQMSLKNYNRFFSIAIPPIGCGCGGLSRSVVKPMIEQVFWDYGGRVDVYGMNDPVQQK